MKRRSIALQLAVWLSAAMLVFWLGGAAISSLVLRSELEQAFDETLRQSAFRLLPLANQEVGDDRGRRRDAIPRMEFDDSNRGPGRKGPPPRAIGPSREAFTYIVYDAAGTVRVRAEDAPTVLPALPAADGFFSVDGRRAYKSTDRRSGLGIVVLETTDARSAALWGAIAGLLWPLAALLPLVALGIWLAVRIALKPVERLSHDVALRNGANLAPLNDDDQPAELAPIAREIEGLLERLRAAMDAERTFAASSAHELRTPIAGALAQTQRLARELGEHASAPRLKEIESALRGLSELAERLLQLSRLEAGFARGEEVVDLAPVLALVVRDFEMQSTTAPRVRFEADADADLRHRINPDAFAIAVRNLINNALLHGAADGDVVVESGPGPMVRVRNHGAVLAADVVARLSERFTRGATRASGSGLGLAVVDTIMQQTGGRLILSSPATGWTDGFEATLLLDPQAPVDRRRSVD
ncbi:MAG TPA: HAMP domain-containing sensor histidine kinase [Devosia sp.]|jgi:two-component system OmpR family sensor kinase|uniref:sensor histidine kinase n=1 Tax=Devosia sp. TaxID=1871048 RepID=UPI002DDCB523|nr:HAMP domain-containing sensor histidine kinase [Devosia sp.]HEV2516376.1 HAMP domain-containing sensor histidine kinase [Devosia sp.]